MNPHHDVSISISLEYIQEAQRLVRLAAEELSPVPGYCAEWDDLVELFLLTRKRWHNVNDRWLQERH